MAQAQQTEGAQLRDKLWAFAQWLVVAIVIFLAGVLLGYRLWGKAVELQEQVEELTERNQGLIKERDTERSKVTLIERDKKELERRLEDTKARAAAAEAKAAAALEGQAGQQAPAAEGGGT